MLYYCVLSVLSIPYLESKHCNLIFMLTRMCGREVFHALLYYTGPVTFIDKWSPALQIRTVLLSIQALLSAPNPDDPLANDVAEQWKSNEAHIIETARAWTRI